MPKAVKTAPSITPLMDMLRRRRINHNAATKVISSILKRSPLLREIIIPVLGHGLQMSDRLKMFLVRFGLGLS